MDKEILFLTSVHTLHSFPIYFFVCWDSFLCDVRSLMDYMRVSWEKPQASYWCCLNLCYLRLPVQAQGSSDWLTCRSLLSTCDVCLLGTVQRCPVLVKEGGCFKHRGIQTLAPSSECLSWISLSNFSLLFIPTAPALITLRLLSVGFCFHSLPARVHFMWENGNAFS